MSNVAESPNVVEKAKDRVLYRKSLGKSIGISPFGAIRGEDGFLKPSPEGAWLLPTGKFVAGRPDSQPQPGALWRGYYEAAQYLPTL